jgi:hypothetical protein
VQQQQIEAQQTSEQNKYQFLANQQQAQWQREDELARQKATAKEAAQAGWTNEEKRLGRAGELSNEQLRRALGLGSN